MPGSQLSCRISYYAVSGLKWFDCRQEKLEQLAARFDRKAGMRETWLSENQRLVSQDNFGYDLAAVEAATKKHEAIETDINAYEERVQAVVAVAQELEKENYHDVERINSRSALFLTVTFQCCCQQSSGVIVIEEVISTHCRDYFLM